MREFINENLDHKNIICLDYVSGTSTTQDWGILNGETPGECRVDNAKEELRSYSSSIDGSGILLSEQAWCPERDVWGYFNESYLQIDFNQTKPIYGKKIIMNLNFF